MEHRPTRKNSFAPRPRAARIGALIAIMVLLVPGTSWARKKKPKPLTPEEAFAQRIAGLAAPLYPLHQDESGPIAGNIQKLVVEHMQEWLTQHPPSDKPTPTPYSVDIRRELESVFSAVRYPIYAWPATFAEPWKDHLLIGAGYTLGWRTFERVNAIALFDRSQGTLKLAAVTDFIPRVDQHFEFLPAPPSGDFRFLVYGTRLGKSHPRLSAELYSFDGQDLKSLWKTEDLYDGKLEFENDRVTINYMKENEFVEATTYNRIPPRYRAIYKITPQGFELVTNEQVAAQNP
ncbi:MAG: hypothetical protein ACM3NO_06070 [Deltaproteobacteria bacterium]